MVSFKLLFLKSSIKEEHDKKKSERIIMQGYTLVRVRDERLENLDDLSINSNYYCVSQAPKETDLMICKRLMKTLEEIILQK